MTSDQILAAAGCDEIGTRDIAIIGMAARLPEADDIHQFLENLRTSRDSVRELSAERRRPFWLHRLHPRLLGLRAVASAPATPGARPSPPFGTRISRPDSSSY